MVTDRSHLYLMEGSRGATTVARIPAAGGETELLTIPFGWPEVQDFSQVRSEILVTQFSHRLRWPLWVLPLKTRTMHRVNNVSATCAAWSPDGREIAHIQDRDLYRANYGGTDARKIASLPGGAFWLRWSPDGSRLRFTTGDVMARIGSLSIWRRFRMEQDYILSFPIGTSRKKYVAGIGFRMASISFFNLRATGRRKSGQLANAAAWPIGSRSRSFIRCNSPADN